VKTIGLLGGMSWESTVPYYQIINREVADALAAFIRQSSSCTAQIFTKSSSYSMLIAGTTQLRFSPRGLYSFRVPGPSSWCSARTPCIA
jgi:hypothetical protein